MKKYLFLLVAVVSLALSSGQAYAQRYLPKMMGVELRGGFVNGSKSQLNYYTGIAMSGYTKKANRWVVGAEYLLKNYDYRSTSHSSCSVHSRGRLLPEVPVRSYKDLLPLYRWLCFGRLRNGELGRQTTTRRLYAACQGCLYLWRCHHP